jgi:hypothetical protein
MQHVTNVTAADATAVGRVMQVTKLRVLFTKYQMVICIFFGMYAGNVGNNPIKMVTLAN